MIIGFGFGSPLESILMLILTSALSYLIYKSFRDRKRRNADPYEERERLRQYYYEQRERAREFARQYDLTDEEIERRIDAELNENRYK